MYPVRRLWLGIICLLLLWATRLWGLDLLPLHNDEGLHLTRAVQVWRAHPFYAISDGKIINHWVIAAFYPQNAPVFAGRVATVFIALLGLAAGYALARQVAGPTGALLAASLWTGVPYLFFYERLAFSDAEAGALVPMAVWLSLRVARFGRYRDSLLTGLAFGAAALFKFTAAPFALAITFVILFGSQISRQRRWLNLGLIAVTVALCFIPPLLYLLLKGQDLFSIALGWLGGGAGGEPAFFANLSRLWLQITGFGSLTWPVLSLVGLALLALSRQRGAIPLLLASIVPLLLMMLLGREVLSRHYVVALPLLLTLAGAGLGLGLKRLARQKLQPPFALAGILALGMSFLPFLLTAVVSPPLLPLPAEVRYEHITSHSSGYGLREALRAFPVHIARRDLPIIASMFPDSCHRANYYNVSRLTMRCPEAPGIREIETALAEHGAVYVLADDAPRIGVDVHKLDVQATQLAAFPRPGETLATASVVLWLLEKPKALQAPAANDCSPAAARQARAALGLYQPVQTAGFVRISGQYFYHGQDIHVVRGVNYYPARFPWRRFLTETDLDSVRMELDLLRGAGFNTLRIFLWNEALFACADRTAVPVVATFQRLDSILHEAGTRGFRLIVTLNDLPDLTNQPLYTNPPHIIEQTRFIVERYRGEAAILAWDVRNEGDIDYGSTSALNNRFPKMQVLTWLADTTQAARSLDPNHLITAGWLYDNEATAPYVDFISFHHWGQAAQLQERLAGLRAKTDKPLLMEEFGYSTYRVTPDEQSRLLRDNIALAQTQVTLGWLIWTAFDFPLDATCIRPACPSPDNAEHHFGLWYADYRAKPIVERLRQQE
jgi:hypothetical protein